ncbi:hypothetical protein GH700_20185 [Salmonella enterica]|nr:hypothetical protein [Salmonella enterica]
MSVKHIIVPAALILFAQPVCYAKNFSPEFVRHVFLNLDVTSFPNSWGPQHFPEGTTMKDILKRGGKYEIKECESKKNCIVIHFPYHIKDSPYIDDGWSNYLELIKIKNSKILACFTDVNGWNTYNVTKPLELEKIKDKYTVSKEYHRSIPGCEYYIDGNG